MTDDGAIKLGQQIASMLCDASRTTTYKHALVMALMDYSIEHLPENVNSALAVPIDELSDRVISYYWRQLNPYNESGPLAQGAGKAKQGSILQHVTQLKIEAARQGLKSASATKERFDPQKYQSFRRKISRTLAAMPIPRLQINGKNETFHNKPLFDVGWLPDKFHNGHGDECNWTITMHPGVAWHLTRLSPLLRPFIEQQWRNDVIRFNKVALNNDMLDEFLFGADRSNLQPVAHHLIDLQSNQCFYCEKKLSLQKVHIDHVLPWSRTFNDGVANLVATDSNCNLNKSDYLPAQQHVRNAINRTSSDLISISSLVNMACRIDTTQKMAMNLYRSIPEGDLLWMAYKDVFEPHIPGT